MKQFLLVIFISLATIVHLQAQTVTVTGVVTDAENNEPLPGATVKFDKSRGTVTNEAGKYKAELQPGEYELSISFIGYKNYKEKVTVKEGDKNIFNVALKSGAIQVAQVTTVSQYKKNAAAETVTTEVITKNLIKNTNSNDLGEVVAKTPGVLVQDGQISIRGGSSYSYGVGTRTAVLSDGLSMQSADLGEGQNKMVAVENVKQVEVIKGASSVVYGSSALNGVVNVVTEWPSDPEPKTTIELNTGVSDRPRLAYQRWWQSPPMFTNINLNHQQRIKDVQFVAAANITGIKSFLQTNDEFRVRASFKTRYLHPKIYGLNFGVNGSIMFERSERFFISQDLDSNAFLMRAGSDDQYIRTNVDPFVSYTNARGHRFTANWRYMNIFRKGGGTDPDAISHQLITDHQYQYRLKKLLVLTAGLPFTVGVSSSNLYEGLRPNFNAALYTQAELNYKILSLQAGVRYEVAGVDTTIVSGIPVFRSGINIQAAKATFVRASWGQGYRIPSIGERFISQEFTNGIMIVPNDTLLPERGWSLELGLKQGVKIGNWMAYFDAAVFWQQYTKFIEFQVGVWDNYYANGTKIFPDSIEFPFAGTGRVLGLRAFNIEDAKIAGYELGLAGNGKIGPVGVQILAGYTYTWPGQNNPDSTGRSSYSTREFFRDMFKYNFRKVDDSLTLERLLYYRIRHLFRADIELTYWKCYLGATFNYGSMPEKVPPLFQIASNLLFGDIKAVDNYLAQRLNGDFFMDMRMGINIKENIKFGFIIKNLTNRYYSLRPGKPEPLRNYTVQFRYTF